MWVVIYLSGSSLELSSNVAFLEGKDNQHSLSGDTNLFVNMSCQVNQKSEVYTLVFCSV